MMMMMVGPDVFWEKQWCCSRPFEATNLCLCRLLVLGVAECQLTVFGYKGRGSEDVFGR
jgi:hypothetical protein